MNPWLIPLGLLGLGSVSSLIAWGLRALVFDKQAQFEKQLAALRVELSQKVDTVDAKYAASAREQGKRIGDTESEVVAIKAVEEERRRVREDTRGIPIAEDRGKRRER